MNTHDKPHPHLLDRYAIRVSNPEVASRIDQAFTALINQMTWIYARCMNTAGARSKMAPVPLLIFRQVVEHVDAAHILSLELASVPAQAHLRTCLEARLYLEFIAQSDWEARAACFAYCSYQSLRTKTLQRADVANLGRGVFAPELEDGSIEAHVGIIDSFLADPVFDQPRMKYAAFVAKRGRPPSWFQLVDPKIRNHRDLALHLDYEGRYRLFQNWSDVVHPQHVFTSFETLESGENPSTRYLRDGYGVDRVLSAAMALSVESANQVLGLFRPDEAQGFQTWVKESLAPMFALKIERRYGSTPTSEAIG